VRLVQPAAHEGEGRRRRQEGVPVVGVVGAHRALVGVELVVDAHELGAARGDAPGVLVELLDGQRPALAVGGRQVEDVARELAHEVAARRPHGQGQLQRRRALGSTLMRTATRCTAARERSTS
jgi:hypothetical protein